jgi:dienelactone hydrolase
VDPAAQAPVAGGHLQYGGDATRTEADAMGLFWALQPDTAGPIGAISTLDPLPVTLRAELEGRTIAEAQIERRLLAPDVTSAPVRDDGLAGRFFRPAGPGPHAAVLVVGGSSGGLVWSKDMAALLASRGYAALALAYFNYAHLPPYLHNIPLEYFETALAWLQRQPAVRPGGAAVVGGSRGGELAMLLGATFAAVSAVVAYVASAVVLPSAGVLGAPAWTHRGAPLPYLFPPDAAARRAALEQRAAARGEPVSYRSWYQENLADRAAAERAAIPVERIGGPVLLFSGEDDQLVPPAAGPDAVAERLARHGHPHPVEHRCYPGAGHQIGLPNRPMAGQSRRHPAWGTTFAYGGTARANARAAADAWRRLLAFLAAWRRPAARADR